MKLSKSISIKLIIVSVFSIILFSCEKQNNIDKIEGSGPIVTEDVNIDDITGIMLEIPATVYLTQGNEQDIQIDAQQNILDRMHKSIEYGSLKLGSKMKFI